MESVGISDTLLKPWGQDGCSEAFALAFRGSYLLQHREEKVSLPGWLSGGGWCGLCLFSPLSQSYYSK